MTASANLPLAGVHVVEFCSTAAGPFSAMLLADLGADVVKVEPPAGDGLRQWPPLRNGFSENFASLNRSKRSVVLDLKLADDVALARKLILDADIVVENNRPGVMDRLGLGYASFEDIHPRLLYCSISAYGQSGPRATEGGFDLTIQAAAGVMSVTGEPDGPPVKCGVPLSDFASGLYAAFSIAASLAHVRAGGRGAHIDVPMFGCTLGVGALQTSEYFGNGISPRKLGSAHPRNAPYQAFKAGDGYFAVAAGNLKLWLAVCGVVDLPALLDDPRFGSPTKRAANQVALKDILEAEFTRKPVDHWITAFEAAGVPHAQYYQQHLLYGDPLDRFSLVSFVWGPGQTTPIHDHTVWGIIAMLRGAEFGQRFTHNSNGQLVPEGTEQRLDAGDIDLVSPRIGDIHQVRNALDDQVSISIHLYGGNIGRIERHVFAPDTGAPKSFVSGYSNRLVPNLWAREAP